MDPHTTHNADNGHIKASQTSSLDKSLMFWCSIYQGSVCISAVESCFFLPYIYIFFIAGKGHSHIGCQIVFLRESTTWYENYVRQSMWRTRKLFYSNGLLKMISAKKKMINDVIKFVGQLGPYFIWKLKQFWTKRWTLTNHVHFHNEIIWNLVIISLET